jgi:hypothetical protein
MEQIGDLAAQRGVERSAIDQGYPLGVRKTRGLREDRFDTLPVIARKGTQRRSPLAR